LPSTSLLDTTARELATTFWNGSPCRMNCMVAVSYFAFEGFGDYAPNNGDRIAGTRITTATATMAIAAVIR
jgi:hypothetical protein